MGQKPHPVFRAYAFQFAVAFALSIVIAAYILYTYTTAPLSLTEPMVRWSVVALLLLSAVLIIADLLFILRKRERMWYIKLVVALVAVIALPPVIYDVYVPPFLILALAIALSICMSVTAFVLQPVNRPLSFIYTLAASLVPFTAPILFYILYQIIQMPHIVEIGGICHIANPTTNPTEKRTLARRIGNKIYTWRRDLLRRKIVAGGGN